MTNTDRNDHTTVTAPLPVCSAKLSTVGPVMSVRKIIYQIMKQRAKNGRLNYGTTNYFGSLKAAIWVTAPSAAYRCQLTLKNP
eukprot:scaffold21767_cov99-Skeletonema_marinoi.AAC.2